MVIALQAPQLSRTATALPDNKPRPDNGEAELARVLTRLGIRWRYEPYSYEIRRCNDQTTVGFQPDFLLEACRRWPEINLELTWADRSLGSDNPHSREAAERALGYKRWRIQQVYELYGIDTLLLTYVDWRRIMRQHQRLITMIERRLWLLPGERHPA